MKRDTHVVEDPGPWDPEVAKAAEKLKIPGCTALNLDEFGNRGHSGVSLINI